MKTGHANLNPFVHALGIASLLFVTSCSLQQGAQTQDIGQFFRASKNGLCEAKFGEPVSKSAPFITKALPSAEDVANSKLGAKLCNGSVPAQLFLRENAALELIQFSQSGQCLDGICVGQRYDEVVSKRKGLTVFVTPEEGGILSLRRDDGVTIGFDTGKMPLNCFEGEAACPKQIGAATVNAIMLGSDTATAQFIIANPIENVGGFSLMSSKAEVRQKFADARWRQLTLEGDAYDVADIGLPNRLNLSVYFDRDKIWKIESSDQRIVDGKGLGVGKQLSQLQAAWPKGTLTLGRADSGPFVNFSNDANLIYSLATDGLAQECFSTSANCTLAKNARVIRIVIYPS
jgi:hypothetical protein